MFVKTMSCLEKIALKKKQFFVAKLYLFEFFYMFYVINKIYIITMPESHSNILNSVNENENA